MTKRKKLKRFQTITQILFDRLLLLHFFLFGFWYVIRSFKCVFNEHEKNFFLDLFILKLIKNVVKVPTYLLPFILG